MRYNSLTYLISEGFSNMFKNTKSTVISIITMICMMFLFGIFFALGVNINSVLEQVQMKQGIEVFIWDEVTEEQTKKLEEGIKNLDGVNTVVYKDKSAALDAAKERMKNMLVLLEGLEGDNNVLPASFVVTFTDLEKAEGIEREIESLGTKILADSNAENADGIDLEVKNENEHNSLIKNIVSGDNVIKTLVSIVKGVRITIGVVFIILLIVSVTIISNTIKLTVHARRKEISIMKYVGATNSFIRGPFIVEGIIIGIIAAILTLVIVGLLYDFIIQKIEASDVLAQIGVSLMMFAEIAKPIMIVYGILGIGIGIVGSSVSMKKYLEV